MAEKILRNGFEVIDRREVINRAELAMSELEKALVLLRSMARLSNNDAQIEGLTGLAVEIIDSAHNDLDVLRECAEKAGIVGELQEEMHA